MIEFVQTVSAHTPFRSVTSRQTRRESFTIPGAGIPAFVDSLNIRDDHCSHIVHSQALRYEQYLLSFDRIYDIVDKQYANKNLSLESIADTLNMSPVYLGRLFKKLTSDSISSYITEVRINKAKTLLLSNDIAISEIADMVGFSSVKYFFTLFKKVNRITPNEFRTKQK